MLVYCFRKSQSFGYGFRRSSSELWDKPISTFWNICLITKPVYCCFYCWLEYLWFYNLSFFDNFAVQFQIGNILASSISGLLLSYFDGWAAPFYFFGVMGVLWFICFVSYWEKLYSLKSSLNFNPSRNSFATKIQRLTLTSQRRRKRIWCRNWNNCHETKISRKLRGDQFLPAFQWYHCKTYESFDYQFVNFGKIFQSHCTNWPRNWILYSRNWLAKVYVWRLKVQC